jgi:hypothetical protein
MGVWEIMEIDKSLQAIAKPQKKLIDPQLDRSLPNNDFFDDSPGERLRQRTELGNSQTDDRDPSTEPCRDCPEGMQW